MILRVLHYNPLSANMLRLAEILRATRNFSIVGLVATQRRASVGLEIGSSKQFGCTIVEAGWARAPLRNKSAGVLIALRKPFTSERIHQTWTHCKVEHSRHVSKEFFSICCMYLPPRPQAGRCPPHCSCRCTSRTRGGQASERDCGETSHEGHFGGIADALMEGVRAGTGRGDFLAAVEDRVKAEETQWAPLPQLHFPDLLDDYLFKKEPMDAPGYADLAARRRELLTQR